LSARCRSTFHAVTFDGGGRFRLADLAPGTYGATATGEGLAAAYAGDLQVDTARQSRSTVASDTSSGSAVSATSRPPKKPELDHLCLARLQPRQLVEGIVQGQELARRGARVGEGVVERDEGGVAAAPFPGIPPPGRVDHHLPHGARRDPLEVQA
jgi:hypothetical protein